MSSTIEEGIPLGSVEHIIVDVTDRLHNVTNLAGSSPKFDVRKRGETTWIQQAITATVIGMRLFCLVDTTVLGYESGRFEMFVYFQNLPESPRLGPIVFPVNA